MGPLADRFPSVHFPVRAELPTGSPHLLPFAGLSARPAAAGAADPAQRMPVIPLCRLAGVKGHGGGERGSGRRGRWNEGGEEVRRGEARAGPAAPAGAVRPATPQGSREYGWLPFNLKGSLSNDPLRLEEKELKYLVTVLNLRKFVSLKLVPSSHCLLICVHFFFPFKNYLPFNKWNFKKQYQWPQSGWTINLNDGSMCEINKVYTLLSTT